ncbi:MAG: Spermidine Putrescine ABC transporter permease component potC (TC_3.A.1.11.1) [Arenicellales bacterium IbO2]|nr:ABC transporter permease subunit [Gammaproteobacteria bacterium]MDA8008579.1 ABC transporter permease subunit [Alphaproteobacteria bacterium]MDA8011243.1 ABC transporter permease subunit [Gammaproteobacteria bacterium]MDA8030225.1 ABC transporter permease subunit [Alphaproteobacteria bacterium]CAJ2376390.1 MAG: Spermidine Putrescine ABC transporter permease component potC (TC_3.A.1.11.1) [Arenicellales bacterium IbO2]
MLLPNHQGRAVRWVYNGYVAAFFVYLAAPLAAACAFAFNDSLFPSMPWQGFTLDWFFNDSEPKLGMFHDSRLRASIFVSAAVAAVIVCLCLMVGTSNAFLFERHDFRFKEICYIFMVLPLVIPGVILGISILVFYSGIANRADDLWSVELEFLRPGLTLVVLGQFSFITTITTLVISARLRKFDRALEEAAFNLGAGQIRVFFSITLPYLRPALLGAGLVAFLVSFENFNTTLVLVGSDSPLTITMFDRMLKDGSTPALNAVSLFLILGSGLLALISILVQRDTTSAAE